MYPSVPSPIYSQITSFSTAIGLRVKDGVVLAVEKLIHSKLLVPGANRRIQTVDRHIGMVKRPVIHLFLYLGPIISRLPQGSSQTVAISRTGHATNVQTFAIT